MSGPPPIPQQPRKSPVNLILWIVIVIAIVALLLFKSAMQPDVIPIAQYRFEQLVDSNLIATARILYDPNSPLTEIVGEYFEIRNGTDVSVPFRTSVRLTGELEDKLLSLPTFSAQQANPIVMNLIWSVLPILIIAAFIWFFFSRIKKTSGLAKVEEINIRASQQQDRWDRILDKWESLANRIEKALDRLER